MYTGAIRIIAILFLFFSISKSQQQPRMFSITQEDLKFPYSDVTSIYFDKASNQLYAASWGDVLKYNSSTKNWESINTNPTSNILPNAKIISLYNHNNFLFAGCDDRTQSYYSTNGGYEWKQTEGVIFTLLNVYCIGRTTTGNIILGTSTGIIISTDLSQNWEKIADSPTYVNSIETTNSGDIYITAPTGVYKSTDDGRTWIKKTGGVTASNYLKVYFNSKSVLYAAASNDLIYSTNNGDNWNSLKNKFPVIPMIGAFGIDKNDFLVVTLVGTHVADLIYISDDDGNTWYPVSGGKPTGLKDYYFESNNDFYAVTLRNTILYKCKIEESPPEDVEEDIIITEYKLFQNHPNPFNPNTVISYQLAVGSHVTLKVYDVLGREVATLVDEYKSPGSYNSQFSILNLPAGRQGSKLSSGVYFYSLKAGDYISTKKMVVVK
ncbi:MAG: T9SS type A sorting domain-containing protein [Melioribacteraceae bacterium]|nr:T9SS type A sorting domain-containing protein [Melioribacteraceae bacterium]